jgi:predicted TIM-barrel fold metal-dependent hydrolase
MFGSNLPVDGLFSSAEKIFLAFDATLKTFSPAEQRGLAQLNAERTYRI